MTAFVLSGKSYYPAFNLLDYPEGREEHVCRRLLLAVVAGYSVASVLRKVAFLNVPCDSFTKSVSLNISHVVR